MPRITRSRNRAKTPERPSDRPQYDTIKRTSFFRDWDKLHLEKNIDEIAAEHDIDGSTGRRWLKQRRELGSPAYRRTRKKSEKLGRKSQVSREECKMLVSPTRNPVRN
jgi:hypothetical protein